MKKRIGIVSDVHGNIEALKTMYGALEERNCTEFYSLGDAIAIGPCPNESMDFLADHNFNMILGNHETYFLGDIPEFMGEIEKKHQSWTHQQISHKNRAIIEKLPYTIEKDFFGIKVLFIHYKYENGAHLAGNPNLSKNDLSEIFKEYKNFDIILYGHTHTRSFITNVDAPKDTRYVNPGSLGATKDNRTKGLVLTIEDNRNISMEFLDINYNKEKTMEAFLINDDPGKEEPMRIFF